MTTNPFAPDGPVEDKASGRAERADIPEDAARPAYRVFPHENVPRIPVGGPAAMAERSQHVAAPAGERTVPAQVLPYAAGRPPS
ncbi:hypothetical protein GCM10010421_20920 [Streptomyces glaucus]|uniref:DUF5753 domain-containing protein n=1 Tax=Streptomyces glaucus TaxID=284029 RepID=A0ABN3JJ85_9ACTN